MNFPIDTPQGAIQTIVRHPATGVLWCSADVFNDPTYALKMNDDTPNYFRWRTMGPSDIAATTAAGVALPQYPGESTDAYRGW